MAQPWPPTLFIKGAMFERNYKIGNPHNDSIKSYFSGRYIAKEKIKKIEIFEILKNDILIKFYHIADTNSVRQNPLTFRVKVK